MLGAMAVSRRSRWALYALAALVVLANIYLMMWAIYGSGAVDASPGGVLLGILAGIFGVGYVGALWMLARKPVRCGIGWVGGWVGGECRLRGVWCGSGAARGGMRQRSALVFRSPQRREGLQPREALR